MSMKRMMKRSISGLLALIMMLNMLPMTVWATEGNPDATPPAEEQEQDNGDSSEDDAVTEEDSSGDEDSEGDESEEENSEADSLGGEDSEDESFEDEDSKDESSEEEVIEDDGAKDGADEESDNPGIALLAEGEETTYTDGMWKFELNTNGFATITKYTGTSSELNIPSKVMVESIEHEVRFIVASAFSENTAITKVALPGTMKQIGPSSFAGCTSLTSITIPENVTFIGQDAFANCNSSLKITYKGTRSEWNALVGNVNIGVTADQVQCVGIEWEYTYDEQSGGVTITGIGTSQVGESVSVPSRLPVTIGDKTNNTRVIAIAAGVFQDNTTLVEVTLPETIREIGENAFAGCTSLTRINYGGTRYRWKQVYRGDNAIPEKVKVSCAPDNYVDDWAYELEGRDELIITGYRGEVKDISIPGKLTIDSVERTVVAIGTEAFKDQGITSVVIPDTVEELETRAFMDCSSLTQVTLSNNLEIIGKGAFLNCSNLTSITIPASVKEIRQEAFMNTTNLSMIAYCGKGKNQLNLINNSGISNCWIVAYDKDLIFLAGYKGTFTDGKATLPETFNQEPITHIGGQAFAERGDITELTIPEGYEHIRPDAFRQCPNLTKINLPVSLNRIEGFAFAKIGGPEDPKQEYREYETVLYSGSDLQWKDIDISPNAFMPYNIDDMIDNGIIKFGTVAEYNLSGTVKDSSGNPISDATVTLAYNDVTSTVTTGADGTYLFEKLSYKYEYTLTATAAGYDSRSVTMELEEDTVYDFLFYKKGNAEGELYLAHLLENELVSFNPAMNFGVQGDRGNQIVFANTLSGLVEQGKDGKIALALAESYTPNDDETVWTFKIKDNIPWVDVNGNIVKDDAGNEIFVTAADFLTTYQLMSSSQTNPELYSSAMVREYIESAAVDGNSITFTLKKPAQNFPNLLAASEFSGFYPMSQKMLDAAAGGSISNLNMWYCGPYLLTDYVEGSYKIYQANPYYWDKDSEVFEKVTVTMVGSYEEAFDLFEAGQLDYVEIDGDIAWELIKEDSAYSENLVSKMLKPFSYQMHWNFDKRDPDTQIGTDESNARPVYASAENWNTAIANEDFRLSLYYGWELSHFYAERNRADALSAENNTNSLVGTVFTTNGTDYTELVKDELGIGDYNGKTMVRYNKTKAEEHRDKAIKALKGEVTFPVSIDYYVQDGDERQEEIAAMLRYSLNRSLGDDYVIVNIRTYEDHHSDEVRDPQFQSLAINGWGNDYSDPYNNLAQYALSGSDDADSGEEGYFSIHYNNSAGLPDGHSVKELFETYTGMLEAADNLSGDARLDALAKAEAYLIQHGLVTPCYLGMGYCIGYIDPDSMTSNTMKDWTVSDKLIAGGEIHDNGIKAYNVWKPQGNDCVFDWILTDDGTLYITGNGSLEGADNNGNNPWKPYKNDIKRIIVSPAVTGLNETGAFKELDKVTKVEWGEYTGIVPSESTYDLRARTGAEIQTYSILTNIAQSAFEGCTSLESIKIPESVTSIGADAFEDTGLTEIDYAGSSADFAAIEGCDDFLFDTYQNLEGEHEFADQNDDDVVNIADVDLLYRATNQ